MAARPSRVEIRSFQVGFGDCFLVSFLYPGTERRDVLIDFGTTALPAKGKPSALMPAVAKEIEEVCGGRLTAIVATHRHADHISGFGTDGRTGRSGAIIKALKPRLILQPWTEDPKARTDARSATPGGRTGKGFVASLAAMNDLAARVERLAAANPPWMSAAVRRELGFLGADNIANRSAVENLMAMGKASGARARYLRYGDESGLEALLPGVKVHVLGPPDLTQTGSISAQRSKDPDQFWHLVSGAVPRGAAAGANGRAGRGDRTVPIEGRWFRNRLETLTGQSLLEIVRQLDKQMNNTSLILLFEVFGKKLLFPGDAQIENWSYALAEAPDSARVRRLLAEVDFYKVGHHGSLNATPKTLLWAGFRKRKGRQLTTMMSTLPGKHGAPERKTEVPRKTLLAALKAGSRLKSTHELKKGERVHLVTITP